MDMTVRERNLDVVRTMLEKGLAGRFDEIRQFIADDFVCLEPEGLPYRGSYHGWDGYMAVMGALGAAWDDLSVDLIGLIGDDTAVAVRCVLKGTGKNGGERFAMPVTEIWEMRDGQVTKVTPFYFDTNALAVIYERSATAAA